MTGRGEATFAGLFHLSLMFSFLSILLPIIRGSKMSAQTPNTSKIATQFTKDCDFITKTLLCLLARVELPEEVLLYFYNITSCNRANIGSIIYDF